MVNNSKILLKAVVGSQAYNLATPTSDRDIKGIYLQPDEAFLVEGGYEPHFEVNKDEFYFELRNFLKLLGSGNPTAIELLFTPESMIIETSAAFKFIQKYKQDFITKALYDTFGGYALTQLKKAKGLDKKFNWEKSRIDKKEVIDFCRVLPRDIGKPFPLTTFLEEYKVDQSTVALTKVEGFRDVYKLYFTPNPAVEGVVYRGVMKESSHEVRVSEVPKVYADDWVGTVYFNKEAYSRHCRDYKSYKTWLKNRNEVRYKESREGQQYDSKNIAHTARLILTIEKIHRTGTLDIDMTDYRSELLAIKHGEVDLERTFKDFEQRAERLQAMKSESGFPEKVSQDFLNYLELRIRKNE